MVHLIRRVILYILAQVYQAKIGKEKKPNVVVFQHAFHLGSPGYASSPLYREIRGATASTTPKEEVKDAPNGANVEAGVDERNAWSLKSQITLIQSIGSIRWSTIANEPLIMKNRRISG